MPQASSPSLREFLDGRDLTGRLLLAAETTVALADVSRGSSFPGARAPLASEASGQRGHSISARAGHSPEEGSSARTALAGRSVLLASCDQLTTALALIELDGIARRLVLCPPGLPDDQLAEVIATTEADAVVCGADGPPPAARHLPLRFARGTTFVSREGTPIPQRQTEWILLTSGTTGTPKMAVHTLASLIGAIKIDPTRTERIVWATFYDIRRYGGLQIFLRAMLGGTSLVLSSAGEPMAAHLERLGAAGVTHLTGTPTHWRWALVNPSARAISPGYVRMSGEIADQALLDNLHAFFPDAKVGHAYASTEAGVGFEVNDGLEGFPAAMIGNMSGSVEMKVVDGSLRIRSSRTAVHYLGRDAAPLLDADGFVDTGDVLELRGDRYYFVGRRGGIINVGGLKVHPEEIEAVINRHPDVRMSLVRPRKNPITGSIVVADVVLREAGEERADRTADVKREILQACRDSLPQHKVPAAIRFVPSLAVSATGKMVREYA
jgi:acyl-CoA synthetase (AMP-forming)/AMP-acid ligase II